MTTFASAVMRRESRVVVHVRRAVFAVVCIYAVSFCWSIYRRLWQVLRRNPAGRVRELQVRLQP
jgi:hypothetical protein